MRVIVAAFAPVPVERTTPPLRTHSHPVATAASAPAAAASSTGMGASLVQWIETSPAA